MYAFITKPVIGATRQRALLCPSEHVVQAICCGESKSRLGEGDRAHKKATGETDLQARLDPLTEFFSGKEKRRKNAPAASWALRCRESESP